MWGFLKADAGQIGFNFGGFDVSWRVSLVLEDGVREGTQKEGNCDFEASDYQDIIS